MRKFHKNLMPTPEFKKTLDPKQNTNFIGLRRPGMKLDNHMLNLENKTNVNIIEDCDIHNVLIREMRTKIRDETNLDKCNSDIEKGTMESKLHKSHIKKLQESVEKMEEEPNQDYDVHDLLAKDMLNEIEKEIKLECHATSQKWIPAKQDISSDEKLAKELEAEINNIVSRPVQQVLLKLYKQLYK